MTNFNPTLEEVSQGFLRPDPMPSEAFLNQHYTSQYFSSDSANNYEDEYTELDLAHKAIIGDEFLHILEKHKAIGNKRFLDIGCGEGFVMKSFVDEGWQVSGVDLTDDGIMRCNPQLADNLETVSAEKFIDKARANGTKFDAINCKNVVEHVVDSEKLMRGNYD